MKSPKWILGLQAKILRVLQEREVERLGSSRTISLDVRLIATSNRDLPEEVRAARFRADLYYRLNVMSLRLPALRERRGDILPLARRAMQSCARGTQTPLALSPAAEHKLLQHDWPGNARELTNIVQRAAWLAAGGRIDAADLDLGGAQIRGAGAGGPAPPPQEAGLGHDLKERERELILATLRSHRRQPQARRRASRDQSAHAAPQAAAAQGGGSRPVFAAV